MERQEIYKQLDNLIEKARSGVYSNTYENRKKGRVGQKYGSEKSGEEKSGDNNKLGDVPWNSISFNSLKEGGYGLTFNTKNDKKSIKVDGKDVEKLMSGTREERQKIQKEYFNKIKEDKKESGNKVKMELSDYKNKVKELVGDEYDEDDMDQYDIIIDCFSSGVSPDKCAKNLNKGLEPDIIKALGIEVEPNYTPLEQTLIKGLEAGIYDEDYLQKAMGSHKYFKREPKAGGGYKYYYTEAQYKKEKGKDEGEKKDKVFKIEGKIKNIKRQLTNTKTYTNRGFETAKKLREELRGLESELKKEKKEREDKQSTEKKDASGNVIGSKEHIDASIKNIKKYGKDDYEILKRMYSRMIEDDSTDPRIERAVKEQLNKISKEKKENSGEKKDEDESYIKNTTNDMTKVNKWWDSLDSKQKKEFMELRNQGKVKINGKIEDYDVFADYESRITKEDKEKFLNKNK